MKVLSQNFQLDVAMTKPQSRVVNLIVVLFFIEIVLAILGRPIPQNSLYKVYLVLSFGVTLITFMSVFLMKVGGIQKNFLWIILFTLFSFLLGLINGWNLVDILADTGRFIAPFLAYYVGKSLFLKLTLKEIKVAVKRILRGLFYVFLLSLLIKVFSVVVMGDPIVKYPDGGLDVPLLLVAFFVVSWFFLHSPKKFSKYVLLLFISMVLSPLMAASKSGLITLLFFLIFTPVVYGKFKHTAASFILVLIGVGLVLNSDAGMLLINRIAIAIEVVFRGGDVIGDLSSYARVIEANSAIEGLNTSWFFPLSYLFGNGSGALWYTSIALESGLNDENFRVDGGAHHIHIEVLSLLFRHGIVGLAIYLSWMFVVCYRAHKVSRHFINKDIFLMSTSAAIVIVVIASFLTMLTDTSLYGHFYVGLIAAVPAVILKNISQRQ
jgi:hypothetical protein